MVESHSLIDLDDGTTTSYHTAKDSRTDNYHQSTGSIGSDETTSTLHQSLVRDDPINTIHSPEDSFYYDALASPSQSNQQLISSAEKPDVLIDNLSNLLEQIETFNQTHRSSLSTIDEEQFRAQPEGEESQHNVDRLIAIVDDIHRYHEITPNKNSSTMDNLLFLYDQNDDDDGDEEAESKLPTDKMESLPQSSNESSSCVNNLLFTYDDSMTPGDEPEKVIGQGSNEWSYDNLFMDDGEEVKTDHLGTIVHEALAARFQKPIQSKSTGEIKHSPVHTDNLGSIVHEALAARFQKPVKLRSPEPSEQPISSATSGGHSEDPLQGTDNLRGVMHEALANIYQKPITVKSIDHRSDTEQFQSPADETPVDTDHLGIIVHEALAARFQKPVQFKPTDEIDHSPVQTDNLGSIVHEALAARFQKPVKLRDFRTSGGHSEDPLQGTDNLRGVMHEALAKIHQKPISVKSIDHRSDTEQFQSPADETPVDTDHLGSHRA